MWLGLTSLASIAIGVSLAAIWCGHQEYRLFKISREFDKYKKEAADRRREREEVLNRWQDEIAALVGEDLEEIADKLESVAETIANDDKRTLKMLIDVQCDLYHVIGSLLSMDQEEEEL